VTRIHANTAAVGQLQKASAKAMSEASVALSTSDFYPLVYSEIQATARSTTDLIIKILSGSDVRSAQQIDSSEIALVNSTSDGLAVVTEILLSKLPTGSTVAINKGAFASVRIALSVLEQNGVNIIEIGDRDGSVSLDALASIKPPRALYLDYVHHISGIRNDLAAVSTYCEEHQIELIVDAVQAIGALAPDVSLTKVSAFCCGGHKWLRAPEGTGFLYLNRAFLGDAQMIRRGYNSLEEPAKFDVAVPPFVFASGARRVECGTPNTLGLVGLHAALLALLDYGPNAAYERIAETADALTHILLAKDGVEIISRRDKGQGSGIVSFRSNEKNTNILSQRLLERGVTAGVRRGILRLSASYDVDHGALCEVLQSVL
jgi:cysteine desulfurase/selenocysteine lyase